MIDDVSGQTLFSARILTTPYIISGTAILFSFVMLSVSEKELIRWSYKESRPS